MKSALIVIVFTLSSVIITEGGTRRKRENQGTCGGNRLLNAKQLKQGKGLKSCNGEFHLKMQTDGNLVLYDNTNNAIWSSETHGIGQQPYKLVMQEDMNLVVYGQGREVIWSSDTHIDNIRDPSSVAIIQNDGNFVVYGWMDTHSNIGRSPKWSTNTHTQGK